MPYLITTQTPINDASLKAVAHLPTRSLASVVEPAFFSRLADRDFMRIAVWLAQKSFDEGGCPIGGVIVDNDTRNIVGKGHNTLVQENHPYNHGETSALRDAGRIDFSKTTIFTTLTPCDVCATLIYMRKFSRCVIGNTLNQPGNQAMLESKGIAVDILDDEMGIELYARYVKERPDQNQEDWQGLASVNQSR
jgi:cytosine/creatinine deaminase